MKKVIRLIVLMIMCVSIIVPACAAGVEDDTRTGIAYGPMETPSIEEVPQDGKDKKDPLQSELDDLYSNIPHVTTDDIVGRLENKGNDIVNILQTIGRYVCIAAFIICCLLTLIGVMGNPRLLWGGVIGLVLSGVAYAGIVCGRDIVNWIASWAIS